MAKIITLKILVRDDDTQRIEEGLKDMLAAAQSPVDPEADTQPWLAGWSIKSIDPVNDVIEKAVTAGVEDLDSLLEQQFVICFAGATSDKAFFSSEYGAVPLDLATIYTAESIHDPYIDRMGGGWRQWKADNNAYVTKAPFGMSRYIAQVFEAQAGEQGQIKVTELWAANDEKARELVERDHDYKNIVSVRPS